MTFSAAGFVFIIFSISRKQKAQWWFRNAALKVTAILCSSYFGSVAPEGFPDIYSRGVCDWLRLHSELPKPAIHCFPTNDTWLNALTLTEGRWPSLITVATLAKVQLVWCRLFVGLVVAHLPCRAHPDGCLWLKTGHTHEVHLYAFAKTLIYLTFTARLVVSFSRLQVI